MWVERHILSYYSYIHCFRPCHKQCPTSLRDGVEKKSEKKNTKIIVLRAKTQMLHIMFIEQKYRRANPYIATVRESPSYYCNNMIMQTSIVTCIYYDLCTVAVARSDANKPSIHMHNTCRISCIPYGCAARWLRIIYYKYFFFFDISSLLRFVERERLK